jgi:hypothetical protein
MEQYLTDLYIDRPTEIAPTRYFQQIATAQDNWAISGGFGSLFGGHRTDILSLRFSN